MRHIPMWSEQISRLLEFGRASSQIATEETEGRSTANTAHKIVCFQTLKGIDKRIYIAPLY